MLEYNVISADNHIIEAPHTFSVSGKCRWQNFDRHVALEALIGCAPNFAHPSLAEPLVNLVMTELTALE